MIYRTADPELVRLGLARHKFREIDLDVDDWVSKPDNIVLTDGSNIGMSQLEYPGLYTCHYFLELRGKEARNLTVKMLAEMFSTYEAKVIQGLTPVYNKAALWMARHLGFTSYGEIDTWDGPCVLFIMTKDEFMVRHGEVE